MNFMYLRRFSTSSVMKLAVNGVIRQKCGQTLARVRVSQT